MKKPRFLLFLTLALAASLLLSACSGASIVNTWPGLSAGDDAVYLAYQNGVFAININNGNLIWRFPASPEGAKAFYAPPTVANGSIIAGDYTNALHSIDARSGAQNWVFQRETGHFVAGPAVVGDTVLAPSSDSYLYALDKDGAVRWTFRTSNMLWAQPVSDGELVYLPAMDRNLYALRVSDGTEVWRTNMGGSMLNSPVLDDGVLYVDTLDGKVSAVNAADGSVLWTLELGEEIWASPLLHEGRLYFGTSAGSLYALSTDSAVSAENRITWKVDIGSPVIGAGALLPNGLAFVTEGGDLRAVNFNGDPLWTQKVNGKLYTTPVVVNDTLVVAATQGDALLTAFNLDGGQKWIFTLPK